jgi:hypothetical protein
MDKKVWFHLFVPHMIKCNFMKRFRKPRSSANGLNALSTTHRDNAVENTSKVHPWMDLFDDPALHQELDRLMMCNRIV